MLKALKVIFIGSFMSQIFIAILFWAVAGVGYYEYNYYIAEKDQWSPVMIACTIIGFILASYLITKVMKEEQNNQSIETAIARGISRAKAPAAHGLVELFAIGVLTISIAFIIYILLPYFMYIAPSYTAYVGAIQFYRINKLKNKGNDEV